MIFFKKGIHPVTIRSIIYLTILVGVFIFLLIICLKFELLFLYVVSLILCSTWIYTRKLPHALILTIVASSLVSIIYLFFDFLISASVSKLLITLIALGLTFTFPIIPYRRTYRLLLKIIKAASHEKLFYPIISNSSNAFCTNHLVRTELIKKYGYRSLNCRINNECAFGNNFVLAKQFVGVIGKAIKEQLIQEKYYINLWKTDYSSIINGDYDIIEIHENENIENYDALINKTINLLYNEIYRYKPISEIIVQVYGNPQISESTKRLMEKRFLHVKHIK